MTTKTYLENTIIEKKVELTSDESLEEITTGVTIKNLQGLRIKRAKDILHYESINGSDIIAIFEKNGDITTYLISNNNGVLRIETGHAKKGLKPYTILNERLIEVVKNDSICLYDLEKKCFVARINPGQDTYRITYKVQIDDKTSISIVAVTDKSFNLISPTLQIPDLKMDFSVEDNCNIIELIKSDEIDTLIDSYLPEIKEKIAEKEEKEVKKQRKITIKKEFNEFEAMLHTRKK